MALPASQYSVLDGSKVERLSEDTFRVYVAPFKFFAFEVQPVLTLQVQAHDTGCTISMLACKLKGNKLIEAQNTQFAARMTNQGVRRSSTMSEHRVTRSSSGRPCGSCLQCCVNCAA